MLLALLEYRSVRSLLMSLTPNIAIIELILQFNMSDYDYSKEMTPEDDYPLNIPDLKEKQPSQAGSLDNNFDRGEEDDKDIFGLNLLDTYQNQNMLQDNHLDWPSQVPPLIHEGQSNRYDDTQINLNDRTQANSPRYKQALETLIEEFFRTPVDRLTELMRIILDVNGSRSTEAFYSVHTLVFLKQVLNHLGKVSEMDAYKPLLSEILKQSHLFYSVPISADNLQVIEFYIQQSENAIREKGIVEILQQQEHFKLNSELLDAISSVFVEAYQQQDPFQKRQPSQLYQFIYYKTMSLCYRENKKSLFSNILLISRAPTAQDRNNYLANCEAGIKVEDYASLQKKELEEYASAIIDITTDSAEYANNYLFSFVGWLLNENNTVMERKILGFITLVDLTEIAKKKQIFNKCLINWLVSNQIIDNYLRQSTHSRILHHIYPILLFLYEKGEISIPYLCKLMKISQNSEDIFKIVQNLFSKLNLQDVDEIFGVLRSEVKDKKSLHFSQFVASIACNSTLHKGNNKQQHILAQELQREEGQIHQQPNQDPAKVQLVNNIFHFLLEMVHSDEQLFITTLVRFLNLHMKLINSLEQTIINELKNSSPAGLWIQQLCLKAWTSSQVQPNPKEEQIKRLYSQGAYQLTLALLAKHRFKRHIVDKALAVVILFCRHHKPLERVATQFLWKVLGTTARDERQREQFFVFLKEIVRFQGVVSEESVNFIFFQILMGLVAQWYSLRVYDCLEMLFLRLNEDCKLITFQVDHYIINQTNLIGAAKFWYIFFNCKDMKVMKKSKDFLCKLVNNSGEKQQQLYQQSLINFRRYVKGSIGLTGKQGMIDRQQTVILRGFQIAEKLLFERERGDQFAKPGLITLKIVDSRSDSFQKVKQLQLGQKISLSDMRQYIAQNLNPPIKSNEFELLNKGKVLLGDNQTLKQMKLQNLQTITVSLKSIIENDLELQRHKVETKKNQIQYLIDLGFNFTTQFLEFIVDKFQGQSLEHIVGDLFQESRVLELRQQFSRKKEESEEIGGLVSISETPKKFGEMLVETKDDISLLLECVNLRVDKRNAWIFIKKLPHNPQYLKLVETYIQSSQWSNLFAECNFHQQKMYIIHILTCIVRQSQTKSDYVFVQKGLNKYLTQWVSEIVQRQPNKLADYEDLLRLLLLSVNNCPIFTLLDSFLASKKSLDEQQELPEKIRNIIDQQVRCKSTINSKMCQNVLNCLAQYNYSEKISILATKVYLYHLYYSSTPAVYSILLSPYLHGLLLKIGKPMYFAVIATALKSLGNSCLLREGNLSYLSLNLFSKFEDSKLTKENTHYVPFFCCLQRLLSLSGNDEPQYELKYLFGIFNHILQNISTLLEEELIGYIKIGLKLLERHLKTAGTQRMNEQLLEFSKWLFDHYLFNISQSLSHFKSKNIRKNAYRLIRKLCEYHAINQTIVFSITSLTQNFKAQPKEGGQFRNNDFIGIKNMGATCYINSLLQQLYHTIFPKLLLELEPTIDRLIQLKRIFVNLYIGAKSPLQIEEYVKTVKINGEFIHPKMQQDANQYFTSLMHQIQDCGGKKAIQQTFSGTLSHQIKGLEEGSEENNLQMSFLTLILEIKGKKNLHEALVALTKQQILQGENMYLSVKLNKKIKASSRQYLDKLPNLLVITLKRFNWCFQTKIHNKINDYFEFPQQLQLSGYAIPKKREGQHYYDYKLRGILIHSGSAESGHYYSIIKVGSIWLEFNDRQVREWNVQNMKTECYGGTYDKNCNAYMLLYERVNSNTHGASLHLLEANNKLLQKVKQQNEYFIKNRLICDSNYIDFIKEMSNIQGNGHLLQLLKSLNLNYGVMEQENTYMTTPDIIDFISIPDDGAKNSSPFTLQSFVYNRAIDSDAVKLRKISNDGQAERTKSRQNEANE